MMFRPSTLLVAALLVGMGGPSMFCEAQNVVGIDFGSEWIKIAVVQRSAGVQIVFNEASKRKSPNALAFDDVERQFGDTALVKAHKAMPHTRELLGKGIKAEILKGYGPHYFPYEIIEDEERGAIKIKESDRMLSPEVLVAMVLTYAKMMAAAQTKEKVADCVITVPAFFRQFERQALLDAAAIAGLNVLAVMNDHTAVALKYGIDHNVAALTEPQNVLFYDMGSTATKVALVQFSSIEDKEAFQKNKTLGQLKVLSVAWDETLGGHAFTAKVADILAKKSKHDPTKDKRAMAKLIQTAEKTKIILSANKNAHPSIESFIDDYDFRASIDRAEFEQEAKDLFERVDKPIIQALAGANMTIDDLHKVEVIGGGWRIPKVQDYLLAAVKRTQLDKTMNADEAFCFGAALYAASLSTAFRLRKFGVHDITSFAVSIDLDSLGSSEVQEDADEEEGTEEKAVPASTKKNIKLFKVGHKIPAKRLLTFKRDEDLTFTVQYDDEVPAGTPALLAKYNITGVKAAMEKYPKGGKPKINVSFRLTRSGLVDVDKAEAALEEMVEVEVCEKVKKEKSNETNSTDSNSTEAGAEASEKKDGEDEEKEVGEKEEEEKKESDDEKDDQEKKEEGEEKKVDEESEQKDGDEKEGDEKEKNSKDKKKDKKDKKKKKKDEDEYEKVCTMKEEKRVHRVSLKVSAETPVLKPFNSTQIKDSKTVLKGYEEREETIRQRASAFNGLEAYIYNTREKLENNEEVKAVTTPESREKFTEELNKMSTWLEEDGFEAPTDVLRTKLSELTDIGDPVFYRVREMIDRPEAVKKAFEYLETTLGTVKNLTSKNTWLNESHTQIVTNKTDQIYEWLANKTAEQEKLAASDTPAFSADEIYRRLDPLQELYKRLARIPKPAPPKKDKKKGKADDAANATETEGEGEEKNDAEGAGEGEEEKKEEDMKEDGDTETKTDAKEDAKEEL